MATATATTAPAKAITLKKEKIGFWDKVFKNELEENRYGVTAFVLIIVGCLGSMAVGTGAIESVGQLAIVVFPTMAVLSGCLSLAPVKWILNLSVAAIAIDLSVMLYNFMN